MLTCPSFPPLLPLLSSPLPRRRYGEDVVGFKYVASGPLVRSSYRAAEAFLKGVLNGESSESSPYTDRYGKQHKRLTVVT